MVIYSSQYNPGYKHLNYYGKLIFILICFDVPYRFSASSRLLYFLSINNFIFCFRRGRNPSKYALVVEFK